MDKNENEYTEVMDDEEVFLTKEIKPMNEEEFEKEKTMNLEIIKGIYENDYSEKNDKALKKGRIKYLISIMTWLLFVVFTTIVMYIVIREPDAITKIIQKIF